MIGVWTNAYHVDDVEADREGDTGTEAIVDTWSNNDIIA